MKNEDKTLDELIAIKKLLMLQLLHRGVGASEISKTLGLTQARISQLVPVREVKRSRKA